jgi:hypothetical protein
VIDFPLFEYAEESNRWVARHHPFTSPKPNQIQMMIDLLSLPGEPGLLFLNLHTMSPSVSGSLPTRTG